MSSLTPNYGWILPSINDPTDQDLWGGYLNSNLSSQDTIVKAISDSVAAAVPVGSLFDFAGASAPTNYLLCYGQAINRVTYADLFTAIGTTYGIGDGTTTFNIPDFRGRVAVGQDDMGGSSADRITTAGCGIDGDVLGASGGTESSTLVTANLAAHDHFISANITGDATTVISASNYLTKEGSIQGSGDAEYILQGTTDAVPTLGLTSQTGSGTAFSNVQPTLIVNKIIKAL